MSNIACKGDVLTFFEKENRPFSVIDVCNALKNYGKTGISRALDDLVEEGSIKEKAYGKQKVYVYDQNKLPSFDENEIKKMEVQSANLSVELTEEQKKLKSVSEELKRVTSSLTKEEAEKELTQVKEKLKEIETEVKSLKAKGPGITEADLKSVSENHTKMINEWKKRKRIAMNIVDAVAESYPSSKKQLMIVHYVFNDQKNNITSAEKFRDVFLVVRHQDMKIHSYSFVIMLQRQILPTTADG
ncbi:unnamed protein product [Schistosoma rodhaini]|nr:unnamed protein product [Schistosoma rodhaini]